LIYKNKIKGMLAISSNNSIKIFADVNELNNKAYLTHKLPIFDGFNTTNSLQFCPYEDILGVGHLNGFSSIIVPGNLN
jgi:U3 small nucleolar RNA-associated protein 7